MLTIISSCKAPECAFYSHNSTLVWWTIIDVVPSMTTYAHRNHPSRMASAVLWTQTCDSIRQRITFLTCKCRVRVGFELNHNFDIFNFSFILVEGNFPSETKRRRSFSHNSTFWCITFTQQVNLSVRKQPDQFRFIYRHNQFNHSVIDWHNQ